MRNQSRRCKCAGLKFRPVPAGRNSRPAPRLAFCPLSQNTARDSLTTLMKYSTLLVTLSALAPAFADNSTPAPAPTGEWTTKQVSPYFWAEGACAADVNKDGKVDILSGPFWYEGPSF